MASVDAVSGGAANYPPSGAGRPTDLKNLSSSKATSKIVQTALSNPLWIFGLLRTIAPVFRIPGTDWMIVSRFDHVKEVLAADQAFTVPWDDKMKALNDGKATFLLGVDDRKKHQDSLKLLMKVFRREDLPKIAAMARREAESILDAHLKKSAGAGEPDGRASNFDAIADLITRVPTCLCRDYYGIPIGKDEEDAFAEWALGMSAYLFADPTGDEKFAKVGLAAGAAMGRLLDNAIALTEARETSDDTILERLVALRRADPTITHDMIRANLAGMVTGFVPTNTMAAGHMLDAIVGGGWFLSWRRSMFMEPAKKAIQDRDDERFFRCLMETLRFRPINPGPFRNCRQDYTFGDAGFFGRGAKTIRKDAKVLASTQSAMFDGRRVRRARKFDLDRSSSEYMHFGSALHVCLGAFIAEAQITPTLRALLERKNLRRAPGAAGKLRRAGPFPAHLMVRFDA
jgi:cytochrome P450